jgi:type III pantothenate kinase
MNLCIDQGNSSTKAGIFDQNELVECFTYREFKKEDVSALFEKFMIDACIISSVISENKALKDELKSKAELFIELSHLTPVPVVNKYKTPETLGKDRLAAVIGAVYLEPDTDILVVDAGTAITYDFIDADNVYRGGNIAAGIDIRLKSLHEYTQKLPIVEAVTESPLLGNDTNSAIVSGALHGIVFEIDGYISALKIKYPQLSTFLTGGSTFYFDTKLKSAIFAEPNLVLIGLNRILLYNVQK